MSGNYLPAHCPANAPHCLALSAGPTAGAQLSSSVGWRKEAVWGPAEPEAQQNGWSPSLVWDNRYHSPPLWTQLVAPLQGRGDVHH